MKFFNNTVNRIMSALFWVIGWVVSYMIIFGLGYDEGRVEVVNAMYYYCVESVPIEFDNDANEYLCAKAWKL